MLSSQKLPATRCHRQFSPADVRSLATRFSNGDENIENIHAKDGKVVCRAGISEGQTVVLKMWSTKGFRTALRQITHTGSVYRELRILNHLHRNHIRVPSVLGYSRLSRRVSPYWYGIVLEDLGVVQTAMDHLSRLRREEKSNASRIFENLVIEQAATVIDARVINPDYSLRNIVVTSEEKPILLDFEIASKVLFPGLASKRYGRMIGRLITTYIFTVQPDTDAAVCFAKRLIKRLNPPHAVRQQARQFVQEKMEQQRIDSQIDTYFNFSW